MHLAVLLRDGEIEMTPVESRGPLSIAADVRLDTRAELTRALSCPPDIGDAQLLLAAYAAWGEGMLDRLVGDFAFVLWDSAARRLICARDQLGIRPLYWTRNNGTFRCASSVAALVGCPDVPRRLDESRMADYLGLAPPAPDATFFLHVRRLSAGECLIVERDEVRRRRYWTPDAAHEVRLRDAGEYAEAFLHFFTAAVRARLRGAASVACTLSGGIDSSSIACLVRRVAPALPLRTISLVFDRLERCDERRFIHQVTTRENLEGSAVVADHLDPWEDVDRTIATLAEPFSPANLFLHLALFRESRRSGAHVLLNGFDGDAVVSHGWLRLLDLSRAWRWSAAFSEADALGRIARRNRWAVLARYGLRPSAPRVARAAWRALRHGEDAARWHFASRRIRERVGRRGRDRREPPRSARTAHAARVGDPALSYTFEVVAAAAAAHGVEPRYPFFDRRLVEFCLALPGDQQLDAGWSRVVQRRAMRGILPASVRWRRDKADLTDVFLHGFRRGARPAFEALVTGDRGGTTLAAEYVDLDRLGDVARGASPPDAETANAAWHAMTLARWLQRQESGGI